MRVVLLLRSVAVTGWSGVLTSRLESGVLTSRLMGRGGMVLGSGGVLLLGIVMDGGRLLRLLVLNMGWSLVLRVSVVFSGVVLSVWLGGVIVDLSVLSLHVVTTVLLSGCVMLGSGGMVLGSGGMVLGSGGIVLLSGGVMLGSGVLTSRLESGVLTSRLVGRGGMVLGSGGVLLLL